MTTLPTHEHAPSIVPAGKMPLSPMHRPNRPTAGAGGMTGRDVMRIIRKHLWLILIMLTVFTLVSIGGTMLWLRYAPTYTSTAALRVIPPQVNVYATDARTVAADLEIRQQTFVHSAKVESVLTRAINKDQTEEGAKRDRIRGTTFFTGELDSTVALLQKKLAVSAIRDTELIRISLSGTNRKELPEVVNAVADALVSKSIDDSQQRRAGQMKSLNARLEETISTIAARQKSIEQIRGQSEVSLMRANLTITQVALQALTTELTQLRLLKAQAQAAYDALQEQKKNDTLATSPEVLQVLEQDPTYRSLVITAENIQIDLSTLEATLAPEHRRVKATKVRLETVIAKRDKMKGELVQKQITAMLQMQEAQVIAVNERLLSVGNQFNEQSSRLRDLGTALAKIVKFEDEIERQQGTADQINKALLEFRIARDNVPISVQALGEIPIAPSMPKYVIMVPLGVFLGLTVGLGLAFLMELMDTSIKSPTDISRKIDLPLLGMIPHEDDLEEEIEDMRTLMLTNADSLAGEAYRQIRTCLLFSGPASQRRSLMITSPSPGDGRTAVTLNLAASIAQGGRKVLVVDANFRQPSLSNLFPQAPKSGLSSALVGQGRWEDNVHQVDGNLSVMAAGPLPPNPAELLGSEQMGTIVGEMSAKYDQVIFDAAPALVVTDPSVLASKVDGVIIVVRAGTSTHGILQRTRDIFLHVGAHVIGAVLNCVRTTAGGYLKKNYNTFYEYRSQQLPDRAGVSAPKSPFPPEQQPLDNIASPDQGESADDTDLS
jgi:polysaccharide biosynthesis transport protein